MDLPGLGSDRTASGNAALQRIMQHRSAGDSRRMDRLSAKLLRLQ